MSTFLSSAAPSCVFISQLICYERACRNYADVLYRARLLTIGLLEQGCVAKFEVITIEVLWSSSWTCGSLQSLFCIHLHFENRFVQSVLDFNFPFVYTGFDFLWSTLRVFLLCRKAEEGAYPTGASGPCSQFLVESHLLIYLCCLVRTILIILCSWLCLSIFYHLAPIIVVVNIFFIRLKVFLLNSWT